jgi:hypothetical protein
MYPAGVPQHMGHSGRNPRHSPQGSPGVAPEYGTDDATAT